MNDEMIMNCEIIGFDTNSEKLNQIKDMIKIQQNFACRDMFTNSVVSAALQNISFGYLCWMPNAQIGRRSRKLLQDRYTVMGFIICRLTPTKDACSIELICGAKGYGLGTTFIQMVEEDCRSLGIKMIQLYAINESSLVAWYQSLGFKILNQVYTSSGEVKAQNMYKFL